TAATPPASWTTTRARSFPSSTTRCACTACVATSACPRPRCTPRSAPTRCSVTCPSCSPTASISSSSPTVARLAPASRGSPAAPARHQRGYRRHNGELLERDDLKQHLSDILSGMFSLGGQPDTAIVQQRIRLHPAFAAVTYKGIPDVRVILYRNEPAMAMLRLPTREAGGRANPHPGGLGAGGGLGTGLAHHAAARNR